MGRTVPLASAAERPARAPRAACLAGAVELRPRRSVAARQAGTAAPAPVGGWR
jgi:hypothetical protein